MHRHISILSVSAKRLWPSDLPTTNQHAHNFTHSFANYKSIKMHCYRTLFFLGLCWAASDAQHLRSSIKARDERELNTKKNKGGGGATPSVPVCPTVAPGVMCIALYKPVTCGVNCQYSNSCQAEAAGWSASQCK
jgi:hypothetical protein